MFATDPRAWLGIRPTASESPRPCRARWPRAGRRDDRRSIGSASPCPPSDPRSELTNRGTVARAPTRRRPGAGVEICAVLEDCQTAICWRSDLVDFVSGLDQHMCVPEAADGFSRRARSRGRGGGRSRPAARCPVSTWPSCSSRHLRGSRCGSQRVHVRRTGHATRRDDMRASPEALELSSRWSRPTGSPGDSGRTVARRQRRNRDVAPSPELLAPPHGCSRQSR